MVKKKIIMIVDDDTNFLEQFEEMLNLSGYETEKYKSGDAALSALDDHKPDLILLDLKMEGKSGFEVAEILHNNPSTSEIPVIVMSSFYNNHHFEELTKEYGVRRCLSKPIKPLDVISEIETIFGKTK